MYNFRYYAIGHSYLKHGPFNGWQTEGFWGMAASAPECDYFHKFQEGLKNEFDCKVEAIAENHAPYERLCTVDATEDKYTSSAEYAHIREVLLNFKPNVVTLLIGGGNTPAGDDASLTRFFEVLYALVAEYKRPETVVICPAMRPNLTRLSKPIADRYGFVSVDISFIHSNPNRDNPYYAFSDYPEYDERRAMGAVEFRTHPNDRGHAAIATAMLSAAKASLADIPDGEFIEDYKYTEYIANKTPSRFSIETSHEMTVSYFGFNIRQNGDSVTFGAAPGTGASLLAEGIKGADGCKMIYTELAVKGVKGGDKLNFTVKRGEREEQYSIDIPHSEMHLFELPLAEDSGKISSVRISPDTTECVITVKSLGFK